MKCMEIWGYRLQPANAPRIRMEAQAQHYGRLRQTQETQEILPSTSGCNSGQNCKGNTMDLVQLQEILQLPELPGPKQVRAKAFKVMLSMGPASSSR